MENKKNLKRSPFIYGRPLKPHEFFDRDQNIREVWDGIIKGMSIAISGKPKIGKTSLINKIKDKDSFKSAKELKDEQVSSFVFLYIDTSTLKPNFTPNDFWKSIGLKLQKTFYNNEAFKNLNSLKVNQEYVHDLFDRIEEFKIRLVLILDEFEVLLNHPHFRDYSFWAQIRSLATTRSFVVIISISSHVKEIEDKGRELLDRGSPLFNYFKEIRLKAFDEKLALKFLNIVTPSWPDDYKKTIINLAGTHPALIQLVGDKLFHINPKGLNREIVNNFLSELQTMSNNFFSEIWEFSKISEKYAAYVILVKGLRNMNLNNLHLNNFLKSAIRNIDIPTLLSYAIVQEGLQSLKNLGLIYEESNDFFPYNLFLFWLLQNSESIQEEIYGLLNSQSEKMRNNFHANVLKGFGNTIFNAFFNNIVTILLKAFLKT